MKNSSTFCCLHASSALLVVLFFLSSCEKADDNMSLQTNTINANRTDTGRYLTFATPAEFERIIHEIDSVAPGETIDGHLNLWKQQHGGFYSMRENYAERAAAGDSVESPVRDDFFAAMLSPEGTIQIAERIYRLDFDKQRVYYIHESQAPELYEELIIGSPKSEKIRYYYFDEEVLYFTKDDPGTPATQSRPKLGFGVGVGCGTGADGNWDDGYDYLSDRKRMKCNAEYQKFGIYFSLLAKVKYQERRLRIWWAKDACMTIVPDPGAYWREKCLTYTNYHNSVVANACDDNKAVIRYHESTRGLNRYQIAVKFRVGTFTSRHYTITY
jgi:hypothetical protein